MRSLRPKAGASATSAHENQRIFGRVRGDVTIEEKRVEVMRNAFSRMQINQGDEVARSYVNQSLFTATAYPGTHMWNVVKEDLQEHFGINHDSNGEPICDDAFHDYVLELDDATKVLNNKNGDPVNLGSMPMDTFLEAREHANNGELDKILEMD